MSLSGSASSLAADPNGNRSVRVRYAKYGLTIAREETRSIGTRRRVPSAATIPTGAATDGVGLAPAAMVTCDCY
jgi:hypothetical protein